MGSKKQIQGKRAQIYAVPIALGLVKRSPKRAGREGGVLLINKQVQQQVVGRSTAAVAATTSRNKRRASEKDNQSRPQKRCSKQLICRRSCQSSGLRLLPFRLSFASPGSIHSNTLYHHHHHHHLIPCLRFQMICKLAPCSLFFFQSLVHFCS